MKLHKQIIFGALLSITSVASFAKPVLLDRVVAIVDQGVVLESQLNDRLDQVMQRARSGGMGLPEEEALKEQILDHLITEQLQLAMADRVGLVIQDQQVNAAIANIMRQNNLSPDQFSAQLERDGMSIEAFKRQIRRDMTIQQISQAMVQQRIQISQLEIDNFLNSADAQFWISPEYHLGHILIGLPQSPTTEDVAAAKRKADAIVDKIRSGGVFAEFAIAESKGPAALKGGDLGWRKTTELPSLFADIVPKLQVGGVSDPARSGAGFHILKLYEKRGEEQQLQTQTKVRHILLETSAILSSDEAKAKLTKLRKQILDGEDFAKLAKENSDDIGSMLAGGDLGWSKPGMFVPEFEKVVKETEVGEISQPFESQYGWHILQVEDRKEEDVSEEMLRMKAANILGNRRFEDELQLWLRELRDSAFVEIKI